MGAVWRSNAAEQTWYPTAFATNEPYTLTFRTSSANVAPRREPSPRPRNRYERRVMAKLGREDMIRRVERVWGEMPREGYFGHDKWLGALLEVLRA